MNIRTITSAQTRKIAFVVLVLAISVYLRLNGVCWGTDSSYASNYHPDESVSMVGMRQIDLLHGRIEAPAVYFEGTFNYYLRALPIAGAQLIGYHVDAAFDDVPTGDYRLFVIDTEANPLLACPTQQTTVK
jgi:hypothetical protein